MATNYNPAQSLLMVLYYVLDAANTKSYSGSGTTFFDVKW